MRGKPLIEGRRYGQRAQDNAIVFFPSEASLQSPHTPLCSRFRLHPLVLHPFLFALYVLQLKSLRFFLCLLYSISILIFALLAFLSSASSSERFTLFSDEVLFIAIIVVVSIMIIINIISTFMIIVFIITIIVVVSVVVIIALILIIIIIIIGDIIIIVIIIIIIISYTILFLFLPVHPADYIVSYYLAS